MSLFAKSFGRFHFSTAAAASASPASAVASSILTKQLAINPNRNAVRFENQNRTWTFSDLDTHSNAFAYGLTELGWKSGDKLLVWAEKNHNCEIVTAQLAAAKTGVTLIPVYAQSAEELATALNSTQAAGVLLSPNSTIGQQKYIDIINAAVPELSTNLKGASLKSAKFPSLKHVIHTGFYSFAGTYKFRQVMVYASKNFNTLALPQVELNAPLIVSGNQTHSLADLVKLNEKARKTSQPASVTFITGDARTPLSFSIGVLNSLLHGVNSVYTGAQNLNQVGQSIRFYEHPLLLADQDVIKATKNIESDDNFAGLAGIATYDSSSESAIKQLFNGKQVPQLTL